MDAGLDAGGDDRVALGLAADLHELLDPRGAGYNAAWIVFRTRPHLHIARQVVVEIRGLKGCSYGGSGAPNCVRATDIQASQLVTRGHRYRVRFYARRARTARPRRCAGRSR